MLEEDERIEGEFFNSCPHGFIKYTKMHTTYNDDNKKPDEPDMPGINCKSL